ncbi:MAG: hypothetical protein AAF721_15540 [Myxococcota bacterium]
MMPESLNLRLVIPLLCTVVPGCFSPSLMDEEEAGSTGEQTSTDGTNMADGPMEDDGGTTSAGVDPETGGDTETPADSSTSGNGSTGGDSGSEGEGDSSSGGDDESDAGSGTDGGSSSGGEESSTGTPSVCGDNIVEGDEECDEGGLATETCDIDCTAVVCGDGIVNAIAGEICEPGDEYLNANCDSCVVECNGGFADCDGAVGCEVPLNSHANCTSCGLEPVSYFLTPVTSASMSPDEKWQEPDTLAVRSGDEEYTGWLGFDTSSLPQDAWPILGFMSLRLTDEAGNPGNVPGILIRYAEANDWDGDDVQPGEITSAGNLSIGQWNLTEGNYTPADWNLIQLTPGNNVADWWPQDAEDGWLTIGVDEGSTEDRHAHFWGATGGEFDPQLQLVLCE